jgi:outer membrane autotransporter protein
MINLAYNDYDGARLVSIGTINRIAKGDYQGWQYGAKIAGGYNIDSGKLVFTPTVSLQYSHLDLDGYTETGADSLNLTVNSESFDQVRTSLGARVAYDLKSGIGGIKLELHAAWLYDVVADKQEFTSIYSGGGAAFKTEGASPARHGANVGASITLHSTGNVSLSANYDAEIKDRYISHNGMLTARYSY